MAGHSRYDVGDNAAGLEGEILKNIPGITDQKLLADTETILLSDAYKHFLPLTEQGGMVFDNTLLFSIHKYFLGTLYPWAGQVRKVDISKEGMLFAPVAHIGQSVRFLETIMRENIPSSRDSKRAVARKLAIIHAEFNAIHPFREGNGRTIRLFLDLIAVSIGFDLIDYRTSAKQTYIKACVAGMSQDYAPMERVIYRGLKRIN